MKVTILHFIICRPIHNRNLSEALQFCLSILHKKAQKLHAYNKDNSMETPLVFSCFVDTTVHLQSTQLNAYVHNLILIGQILHLSSEVAFSIETTFCVHSSSQGLIFVHISEPQTGIQCTQEFSGYSVVHKRVQNSFLCDLI